MIKLFKYISIPLAALLLASCEAKNPIISNDEFKNNVLNKVEEHRLGSDFKGRTLSYKKMERNVDTLKFTSLEYQVDTSKYGKLIEKPEPVKVEPRWVEQVGIVSPVIRTDVVDGLVGHRQQQRALATAVVLAGELERPALSFAGNQAVAERSHTDMQRIGGGRRYQTQRLGVLLAVVEAHQLHIKIVLAVGRNVKNKVMQPWTVV